VSALQIHNTLSRSKETFEPRVPGKVGIYVCGPTVYDYFHLGNARTFTTFDMVVRWMRATGFEVKYVRNITDIDDKIMERARERGEPIEALTERMVEAFVEDSARLNLLRPDAEPRATRYVPPMLEMIAALEKKGLAYRGSNGDVFYSVRSFPEYGKLSRRNLDDLRSGERVAVEVAKKLRAFAYSKSDEFETSTTTAAPSRAAARPSPVMLLMPRRGEAGTTS